MPCRQPLDMPTGFLDSSVPKNQTLNFTIFALEDVLLKVRVLESILARLQCCLYSPHTWVRCQSCLELLMERCVTQQPSYFPPRPHDDICRNRAWQTEVHIMHGLYTPAAEFFSNTATLQKISPSRARTRMGTIPESRTLNPFVSFEERKVAKVRFSARCIAKQNQAHRGRKACLETVAPRTP